MRTIGFAAVPPPPPQPATPAPTKAAPADRLATADQAAKRRKKGR